MMEPKPTYARVDFVRGRQRISVDGTGVDRAVALLCACKQEQRRNSPPALARTVT